MSYDVLSGTLTITPEQEPSQETTWCSLVFHGPGLTRDRLRDWLRLCAKQVAMTTSLSSAVVLRSSYTWVKGPLLLPGVTLRNSLPQRIITICPVSDITRGRVHPVCRVTSLPVGGWLPHTLPSLVTAHQHHSWW